MRYYFQVKDHPGKWEHCPDGPFLSRHTGNNFAVGVNNKGEQYVVVNVSDTSAKNLVAGFREVGLL